jgi:hypothetical protein
MAVYLVKAKAVEPTLSQLNERLRTGEISNMRPFGEELHHALTNARVDEDGWVVWEEVDYCRPPLKQEREAVLDHHFRDIQVTPVERGEGWKQIKQYRGLWESARLA